MELPKKGDFYWSDEGLPILIMEVRTMSEGEIGVLDCLDPMERLPCVAAWGFACDKDYHLVKDHRGYWTKQIKEGKCPILKQIAEVK